MAQRPRSSSAASDSSSDSEPSVHLEFDDLILSDFQVELSDENLSALKAEERDRPIVLRDTKLALLNANQFHWKAQNIWRKHLSLKLPANDPPYSIKGRLFLARLNAIPWEETSCPALQFASDCFRQLSPEDKHSVKITPQFRKLIHILAPHVERDPHERDQMEHGMLVPARLLEPGPIKVYHEPVIRKLSSSSNGRTTVRQSRGEDGDDPDVSIGGNASRSTGAILPDVTMDISGGGSSFRPPALSASFPAMGSEFGDPIEADRHDFFDGDESDGPTLQQESQSLGVPGPASALYSQDLRVPGPASALSSQDLRVPGPSSSHSSSSPDDEDTRRRAHRARVDAEARAHTERAARNADQVPQERSRDKPSIPFTIPGPTPRNIDTRQPGTMIVSFASLYIAAKTRTFAEEPLLYHITPVPVRLAHNCVAIFIDPSSIAFAAKDVDNTRTTNLIERQLFLVQGNSLLQITGTPRPDPVAISINHPFLLVARASYFLSSTHAQSSVAWLAQAGLSHVSFPEDQVVTARQEVSASIYAMGWTKTAFRHAAQAGLALLHPQEYYRLHPQHADAPNPFIIPEATPRFPRPASSTPSTTAPFSTPSPRKTSPPFIV